MGKNLDGRYFYSAVCTNVVDGDTIDVNIDLGFHNFAKHRVRLMRVDTPEMNDKDQVTRDHAKEAKLFVMNNIGGLNVIIETRKSDSFGRWLAEVYFETVENGVAVQKNLSDELLVRGYAVPYK